MREQLIQYVSLLFAGANDLEDVKQEILQNTLDRYDDMVGEGRSPESAYRLAISGIGDINEILGAAPHVQSPKAWPVLPAEKQDDPSGKLLRAIAVGLYILCPVPLFVLDGLGMDSIGLCGTLLLVAAATVLIIMGKKKSIASPASETESYRKLDKRITALIWAIGLVVYFTVSFLTKAWFITWLIFPMTATVHGIMKAVAELKGGMRS